MLSRRSSSLPSRTLGKHLSTRESGGLAQPCIDEAATPKGKGVKVQTRTYTTQKEAKMAAVRAYRPAIVRLANGRYACLQAGDVLPQGARAVSRWGTDQWRAYE
jgi:hypothetical protein